ncbi:hypothetical protein FJTKL_12091 [Diaporthe vaccinii]|uniref:Uncharacterized protein n=1 Tax=Diaporthe vaccinii TaxID=105482 RepID=A0ABR4EF79_9PEZI
MDGFDLKNRNGCGDRAACLNCHRIEKAPKEDRQDVQNRSVATDSPLAPPFQTEMRLSIPPKVVIPPIRWKALSSESSATFRLTSRPNAGSYCTRKGNYTPNPNHDGLITENVLKKICSIGQGRISALQTCTMRDGDLLPVVEISFKLPDLLLQFLKFDSFPLPALASGNGVSRSLNGDEVVDVLHIDGR